MTYENAVTMVENLGEDVSYTEFFSPYFKALNVVLKDYDNRAGVARHYTNEDKVKNFLDTLEKTCDKHHEEFFYFNLNTDDYLEIILRFASSD